MGLSDLRKCYLKAQEKEKKDYSFKLINSFDRLITLIAIGEDEKDKMLALIAEVNLIKTKRLYNISKPVFCINILSTIIDGILNGVWKYFCFTDTKLMENFTDLLIKHSTEHRYLIFEYINLCYGKKIKYYDFFTKIGELLFDVVLLYIFSTNYLHLKQHDDFNNNIYQTILKFDKFYYLKQEYYDIFIKKDNYSENEKEYYISNKFNEIYLKANRYIDEFNIYDKSSSFACSEYNSCFVLFDIHNNSINLSNNSFISYQVNNAIIFPIENKTDASLLNYLLSLLTRSSNRILYYETNNKYICLLHNIKGFFGTLFIENVLKLVNKIKTLEPHTTPEYILCSNTQNDKQIINFNNYKFKLLSELTITETDIKFKRYSITKDGDNMKFGNIEHNGTGDIHVTENHYYFYDTDVSSKIQNELNDLKEKCSDEATIRQLDIALENYNQKNEKGFKKALTWLGNNAMDLIKTVAPAVISDLIKNAMNS